MPTLNEKPVWFITGCSTGFGRELARKTLSLGYPTVITARKTSAIQDFADEHGDLALVLELDVTNAEQIASATRHAISHFGRIDVLVNNAAIDHTGWLLETPATEVRATFETNVFAAIACLQAAARAMRDAGRGGSIVNVT